MDNREDLSARSHTSSELIGSDIGSKPFIIYTDGGCDPNPGIGGWGWHRDDGASGHGGQAQTTNNRMELTAILEALKSLPTGAMAVIYSDSQYSVKGLTVWSKGWAAKNWMKKGSPMLNRDLWVALEEQKQRVFANFKWVRGHNGDPGNERADRLAAIGRRAGFERTGRHALDPRAYGTTHTLSHTISDVAAANLSTT
ncbi:ribonuclease H family protein [Bordetella flabilis]|uniref:ribonuclease H family protein n=1 Tax=Bordetella flabilis TaxID=463014 RepID=UPI000A031B96